MTNEEKHPKLIELLNQCANTKTPGALIHNAYFAGLETGRLGAAVSASPQPKYAKCWMVERDSACDPPEFFATEDEATKNACLGLATTHITPLFTSRQFFAAAPAQEPQWERVEGVDVRWDEAAKVFVGKKIILSQGTTQARAVIAVKHALITLGRLISEREISPDAAQEQPVENSTTCEKCDRKLTRKPADRHNWYDLTGSTRCEATDYKLRHSPQKGKP